MNSNNDLKANAHHVTRSHVHSYNPLTSKTFSVYIPTKFKCSYPKMPEIIIDFNDILKLLSNLKPDKASGPHGIKPIMLKEFRDEIASVIQLLFQNQSLQVKYLQIGQKPILK